MDLRTFWLGWRRDILRFVGLCAAALLLASVINHATARARRARQDLAGLLPRGIGDLTGGLGEGAGDVGDDDGDSAAASHVAGEPWTYRARVAPGRWVWVRDRTGSVTVEPAQGESLEVTAVRTFGHSDPGSVRVVAVPSSDGITICALWGSRNNVCGPGEKYRQYSVSHNDVHVRFRVRLPRGVAVGVTTVSGTVRVVGASAPVVAGTVDGDVDAETARGPVNGYSVNGSVHAVMRGFADTGGVKLATVNGSVTAELPAQLDATVSANTVNGSIESDFPLDVSHKFVAHHASGTVGAGGRHVDLNVVNGSIRLKKAGWHPSH